MHTWRPRPNGRSIRKPAADSGIPSSTSPPCPIEPTRPMRRGDPRPAHRPDIAWRRRKPARRPGFWSRLPLSVSAADRAGISASPGVRKRRRSPACAHGAAAAGPRLDPRGQRRGPQLLRVHAGDSASTGRHAQAAPSRAGGGGRRTNRRRRRGCDQGGRRSQDRPRGSNAARPDGRKARRAARRDPVQGIGVRLE